MWLVWILSAGGRHFVEVFPNCDFSTPTSIEVDAYAGHKVVQPGMFYD